MPWNKPGGSGDKDPWKGGDRKNEGPPDLDEIVRKIQSKLGAIFGGGKGRGNGGGGIGKTVGGMSAGVLIVVLIAVWLSTGFYIVQQSERGVVLRFGKKVDVTLAGLRWHIPWPVEKAEKVNVETVSVVEIGYRTDPNSTRKTPVPRESLMITQDLNIIDIEFAVRYRIKDASNYLFNVKNPGLTIHQATESAIREITGKNTMDFILTEGREVVGEKTEVLLQEILDRYKSGIHIERLEMQDAHPPAQVKAAFEDANKAREDEDRIKNVAEAYANDILPRARGQAARMLLEAKGYKASVIARSEGDARRFSQIAREYAKAPRVTRDRLYIEALEQIMSSTTKIMVDQKGGNSLLYLPLDKLMSRAVNKVEEVPAIQETELQPETGVRERGRSRLPSRRVPR